MYITAERQFGKAIEFGVYAGAAAILALRDSLQVSSQ